MFSNAKAVALMRDLQDKLNKRFANGSGINTSSSGFYTDSNNAVWPYILLYNATDGSGEGQPVILIQISGQDDISKDIFGNQTYSYAPHILKFAYELGAAGNETIPAHADIIAAEFEAIKTGVRFQLIEIANGTAVTASAVNAASAVADLDELYWPTKLV